MLFLSPRETSSPSKATPIFINNYRMGRFSTIGFVLLTNLLTQNASALAAAAAASRNLQVFHPPTTPSEALQDLSKHCEELGIDKFDIYGDYHLGTMN